MSSNYPFLHLQARVERIAQAVAEEVKRQHREENRHTREETDPRVDLRIIRPAFRSQPQLGVGAVSRSPRKLSEASAMIDVPTLSVEVTMMGAMQFGRMCRHSKRGSCTARALAASMYVEGFHGEHAAADDARVDGDAHDPEGNHHVGGARFQDDHDNNGEEKDRERQHDVHEAHDHVVDDAPVKPGDDPSGMPTTIGSISDNTPT